jgi:hypothetical protein
MRQDRGYLRPTTFEIPPVALDFEGALGAEQDRLVPILCAQGFLYFAFEPEAGQASRNAPAKPPNLAAGMLPRLTHPKPHCGHLCVPPAIFGKPYSTDTI